MPPDVPMSDKRNNPKPPRRAAPGAGPRHLSDELQRLIETFAERSVRLRELLEVMRGRGYIMLLILLTFPFCTPIPLPGVSTPFGLVVAFIGFRLALLQKPWLPAWLLDKELPARFFPRVLSATRRLARWLERFLKPRLSNMLTWQPVQHVIGMMILICGVLMMLPFPIPFSNGLPALTVLLLAAAMLEEDGYMAIAGSAVFVLTLAFFGAIFWGGAEVLEFLRKFFGDILTPDDAPVSP